jgi:hypothetical protein
VAPLRPDGCYTAKSESLRPLASAAFSQRGCKPRPLQVSPVEALRYLAATLLPLDFDFFDLPAAGRPAPRSASVSPYSAINALTFSIASPRSCFLVCSICLSSASRWAIKSWRVATWNPSFEFRHALSERAKF